jgi:hypothetical protein
MRRLLFALALLFPTLSYGAGSSCSCTGTSSVGDLSWVTCAFAGDDGTGAIPDCALPSSAKGELQGIWTEIVTSCTTAYDISLDLAGSDLMGTAANNRHATAAEWASPLTASGGVLTKPCFYTAPTLKFTNNSDTSCSGKVYVYYRQLRNY